MIYCDIHGDIHGDRLQSRLPTRELLYWLAVHRVSNTLSPLHVALLHSTINWQASSTANEGSYRVQAVLRTCPLLSFKLSSAAVALLETYHKL